MKWISIKEELPKEDEQVLLLVNEEDVIEGCLNSDRQYSDFNFITLYAHGCGCCATSGDIVTHWMKLPKKP